LTDGHGPDGAIEAVGNPATFVAAVDEVCFAGRVVYIGYAKAPVSYETKYFVMKELDIMGSRNATPDDFRDVVSMLESGRYPIEDTITRTVPFAESGEALAAWSANPGAITKIHVEL
jgi:L-galactonate 5-dehydrogenase